MRGKNWVAAVLAVLWPLLCLAEPGDTELISVANAKPASGNTYGLPSISTDGRYVLFLSWSDAFAPGDTNFAADAFVRDRVTGHVVRAAATPGGGFHNGELYRASLSRNGRYVLVSSTSTNLTSDKVPADTWQAFLTDLRTGTTELVSVNSAGAAATVGSFDPASISDDGRYVAFQSYATNFAAGVITGKGQIYVRDRLTKQTRLVSRGPDGRPANETCRDPVITSDGRYVFFESWADNLTAPLPLNQWSHVFMVDLVTGGTPEIIDRDSAGSINDYDTSLNGVSADGRFVVLSTTGGNLVPGDTNDEEDAFLRDRLKGTTERVSVTNSGAQSSYRSVGSSVSDDGRFVAFSSLSSDLVSGDTNRVRDVFVRDRISQTTVRTSVSSAGAQGSDTSLGGGLSGDGRFVVFDSYASNFATTDTNRSADVFVHELGGTIPPPPVETAFTIKPNALGFVDVRVGETPTQNLWLRNKATTALPIEKIFLRGANATEFSVKHDCGKSVSAGSGCAIRVTFAPTSAGDKAAKLRIEAGGLLRLNELTGTAQP